MQALHQTPGAAQAGPEPRLAQAGRWAEHGPGATQDPAEHPHAIGQQAAVAGVVNGRRHHRAVQAQLAPARHDALDNVANAEWTAMGLIPDPDDQFATAVAGHQSKRVSALMISGIAARVQQRALRAVSRALSVAKCWLATASLVSGHKRSAGCSSGV
jgi:hypothetical protein